ncbi:MAG: hypothetical protein RIK87_15345 [Fuerstiella sp.]
MKSHLLRLPAVRVSGTGHQRRSGNDGEFSQKMTTPNGFARCLKGGLRSFPVNGKGFVSVWLSLQDSSTWNL